MDIQVSGTNMELGEALPSHVTSRTDEGIRKYFERGAETTVTFTKGRNAVECEMKSLLASGVYLNAHGEAGDAYGAFEEAMEKLEKRIRRYKRRLKNHHSNAAQPMPFENAAYYLIESPSGEDDQAETHDDDAAPVIIAESQTTLREMTVSAAVLQLDLTDQPAVVFKNAGNGGINVVYRRRDGHIGWVDPAAS